MWLFFQKYLQCCWVIFLLCHSNVIQSFTSNHAGFKHLIPNLYFYNSYIYNSAHNTCNDISIVWAVLDSKKVQVKFSDKNNHEMGSWKFKFSIYEEVDDTEQHLVPSVSRCSINKKGGLIHDLQMKVLKPCSVYKVVVDVSCCCVNCFCSGCKVIQLNKKIIAKSILIKVPKLTQCIFKQADNSLIMYLEEHVKKNQYILYGIYDGNENVWTNRSDTRNITTVIPELVKASSFVNIRVSTCNKCNCSSVAKLMCSVIMAEKKRSDKESSLKTVILLSSSIIAFCLMITLLIYKYFSWQPCKNNSLNTNGIDVHDLGYTEPRFQLEDDCAGEAELHYDNLASC